MPRINVQILSHANDRSLPIFSELEAMYREIREQAYRRFEQRGIAGQRELGDWFDAERELWPATQLAEDDDRLELKVALAGFAPDDVEVMATSHAVIVKATHSKTGKAGRAERVRWSEFRRSDVCRYIPLPAEVEVDKVKADVKHGLLTVTVRKAAQRQTSKAAKAGKSTGPKKSSPKESGSKKSNKKLESDARKPGSKRSAD